MGVIAENENTKIIVLDEQGCEYEIIPTSDLVVTRKDGTLSRISFQKGPIKEAGVNGCQIEDLLTICKHRLEGFQAGDLSCNENKLALTNIEYALYSLHKRTEDRKQRGVEGEYKE